jgi:hypothetical protein
MPCIQFAQSYVAFLEKLKIEIFAAMGHEDTAALLN